MESNIIIWSLQASLQFNSAVNYIANDSFQNADKVRKDILQKIEQLKRYPEIYSIDKYRTQNDGTYRAFELHHYRISYRFKNKQIVILRVRHTAMKPKSY